MPTLSAPAPQPQTIAKRTAAEKIVFPAMQARGMLPRGKVTRNTSAERAIGHSWLLVEPNGAAHSIACRIRWGVVSYGAFTVRYKTGTGKPSELTKRVRSIRQGGSYPGWTVQAEMTDDGVLLQAYVVRTDELYGHFIKVEADEDHFTVHECTRKHPYRAPGGAQFFVVAINERGRTLAGTKSSLLACGVDVRSLVSMDSALRLGL